MRISASIVTLLLPCVSAATLNLTFTASTAQVSFNGGPPANVDLSIDLLASTDKLVNGGGWFGADRYRNLKGYFSSKALGLSDAEGLTPLEVDIGGQASDPGFRNSTVLLVFGDIVNGIFNMQRVGEWNRVSSIGPLLGPATASGPLKVMFKNGDTLSINTLESAEPYGKASFQAHVVPQRSTVITTAAPVEGSLRKLGEKDLYLRTNSNTVQRFRLIAKTQFRDQQGASIRDSLLRAGDQLSVIVNPDDPETAVGVVLVRKRDHRVN